MILVDANLLIYASVQGTAQHETAKSWLEARLNGTVRIGLPWVSLLAFVRITTNPRVFEQSLEVAQAMRQVHDWLAQDVVWIPTETARHAQLLDQFLQEVGSGGNLVTDVHLAALSVAHGLTLCSADRDFAKFTNLKWHNPLEPN